MAHAWDGCCLHGPNVRNMVRAKGRGRSYVKKRAGESYAVGSGRVLRPGACIAGLAALSRPRRRGSGQRHSSGGMGR